MTISSTLVQIAKHNNNIADKYKHWTLKSVFFNWLTFVLPPDWHLYFKQSDKCFMAIKNMKTVHQQKDQGSKWEKEVEGILFHSLL